MVLTRRHITRNPLNYLLPREKNGSFILFFSAPKIKYFLKEEGMLTLEIFKNDYNSYGEKENKKEGEIRIKLNEEFDENDCGRSQRKRFSLGQFSGARTLGWE